MPAYLSQGEEYHCDTVVKDEYSWARPSSPPASMTSDIDINSLLTQISNAPRSLESPEPLEQDISSPHALPDSTHAQSDSAAAATFARPRNRASAGGGTMEERLVLMPEKRALPWRDGVDPGAEIETGGESRRKQIRFGCLLVTRGEVQTVPCNSCANGRGKFKVCVSLPEFFKGACASCQLSGRPNRCSIKRNDDITESPTVPTRQVEEPKNSNSQATTHDSPPVKRRKTSTIPEWESARPQWEQELGDSHARQQQQQHQQQHQQQQQQMNMGRPWVTVNPPTTTGANIINGINGTSAPSAALNAMAWSSVNQHAGAMYAATSSSSNGGFPPERSAREETVGHEDGLALIDALPKNKQRQVYGLISGIQGGIDHLQRELNSLKKALGIDDEE